jgi:2-polyprenyl-3-methyl-5-hydroxy-6-metoxy-1,4-benzoquinol methylase
MTAVRPFELATSRGRQHWNRCAKCKSYYSCETFDISSEVSHTRTRPWGNSEYGLELNERKRGMYLSILRLLRAHARSGSRLLDIGCSYGGFMMEARREGYSVSGLDIVSEAVESCRGQGFPCYVCESITGLNSGEALWDIVSVLDCNYYWPDQTRELRGIWNRLSPGGLLAMRVVDKSWMVTCGLAVRRLAPAAGDKICVRAVNDHRASIPVRSLLRVLQRENFDVLYASPVGALHHDNASMAVRVSFLLGRWIWRLSGRFFAPGCLILARKQST